MKPMRLYDVQTELKNVASSLARQRLWQEESAVNECIDCLKDISTQIEELARWYYAYKRIERTHSAWEKRRDGRHHCSNCGFRAKKVKVILPGKTYEEYEFEKLEDMCPKCNAMMDKNFKFER